MGTSRKPQDQVFSLSRIPDLVEADIVVTNVAGSTTYVEGVDYEFLPDTGNIQLKVLSTGTIVNPVVTSGVGANNIKIVYTSRVSRRHILGAMANRFFRVELAGVGSHGDAYKAVFYKVKFKPSLTLEMISNGYDSALLEVDMDVYLDDSEVNNDNGLFKGFGEIDVALLETVE